MKIAKNLLAKCGGKMDKFDNALSSWRDVPNCSGKSPNEMFLARRTRVGLPMLPGKTGLNVQAAEEGAEARKTQRGEHYKKQPSKPRKKLNINDVVHVQEPTGRKRWLPFQAKVIEINPNGRSYKIEMSNGFQTTKNRRHLMLAQKIEENTPDVAFEEDDPVTLDDIIKADYEYNPDSESDEEDESPE